MLYNLDYLKEFSGGDKEFEKEMIKLFLTQTPEIMNSIQLAINKNSATDAVFHLHKIKSSISMLNSHALYELVCEAEQVAKNKYSTEVLQQHATTINTQLQELYNELNKLI